MPNERDYQVTITSEESLPLLHSPDQKQNGLISKFLHRTCGGCLRSMWPLEWAQMVVLTLIPLIGGVIIGLTNQTSQYKTQLRQPSWAPASWLFAPVWSVLYLMIGFSSFLLWKQGGGVNRQTLPAILIYVIQLVLNFLWIPFFFSWGFMCLALWDIGALWIAIVALILTYSSNSWAGAVLLVPYLLWVSFASALNYSIVTLNGCFPSDINQTLTPG